MLTSPFARPALVLISLSLLALSACRSPGTTLRRADDRPNSPLNRGRAAGTLSPREADCHVHCDRQWQVEPESERVDARARTLFEYGCTSACIDEVSLRAGLQCYAAFGASSAEEWQELYLARGLIEQTAFCINEVRDQSATAQALLAALRADLRSRSAQEAMRAEHEAFRSGDADEAKAARSARRAANQTASWRRVVEAFQAWQAPPELGEPLVRCLESLPLRACGTSTPG